MTNTTDIVYRANVNNITVRVKSLSECRRRINKRFGCGTMLVRRGGFITLNTPERLFQMTTWDGARGLAQVATGRLVVPVLNMLIETGVVTVGKLLVNTRKPGEDYAERREGAV